MKNSVFCIVIMLIIISFCGCSGDKIETYEGHETESKIKIGLSFDSFVIERWQRDRDVFVYTAEELDAEVNVQNANGDVDKQISQIEYFIDKKMDVIVIIAVDSKAFQDVVKRAKDAGIKIVAYDRLLIASDVDLYVSFDNEKVGTLMAETIKNNVPEGGNIITIFGPTTDHNVHL